MHLVFVSSLLPVDKPASGFDIANRVILDCLRAEGARVSLLGYKTPGTTLAPADGVQLLGEQEVTNTRATRTAKLRWLATALSAGTTVSSAKMLACGRGRIEHALAELAPFDGLILNSVQLAGAYLPVFSQQDCIFVAHNVEATSASENARNASNPVERYLYGREARLIGALETTLCQSARFVWTLAEEDRAVLRVDDDNKSATLPLVTRMAPPDPANRERPPQYDLGMIGSWSWRPNRIGLDWFLNEVVPLLPQSFTIAIAGDLTDPPELHHPGLRLLGRVPDARAFLEDCAVVPLASTAGTGVQLKTIETFEMGLPTVATPAALRGVGTVPANCAVENEAGAFAAALTRTVETARGASSSRLDGRPFHQAQLEGMREAMSRGLVRLKGQGQ